MVQMAWSCLADIYTLIMQNCSCACATKLQQANNITLPSLVSLPSAYGDDAWHWPGTATTVQWHLSRSPFHSDTWDLSAILGSAAPLLVLLWGLDNGALADFHRILISVWLDNTPMIILICQKVTDWTTKKQDLKWGISLLLLPVPLVSGTRSNRVAAETAEPWLSNGLGTRSAKSRCEPAWILLRLLLGLLMAIFISR